MMELLIIVAASVNLTLAVICAFSREWICALIFGAAGSLMAASPLYASINHLYTFDLWPFAVAVLAGLVGCIGFVIYDRVTPGRHKTEGRK